MFPLKGYNRSANYPTPVIVSMQDFWHIHKVADTLREAGK
jgi:hypothetical protein